MHFKNTIKRGGHRACFHATMLTNAVIKVTFGDLRAQQERLFSNAACYITQSSTFFDCLFILSLRKNGFKYPALLINIFIL